VQEIAKDKKKKEDARNVEMKAFGLTNYNEFFQPEVVELQVKQRDSLLRQKELALNKSPNLYVSKNRLVLRNLPLFKFYEQELKELMQIVVKDWIKSLPLVEQNEVARKKKLIHQVKILKDSERIDPDTNDKAPSGLGFAELGDERLAKYACLYLNNMSLDGGKKKGGARSLVVDFTLEDARVKRKREDRREKIMKEVGKKKREKKAQSKELMKEKKEKKLPKTINIGEDAPEEEAPKDKTPQVIISDITDIKLLEKMKNDTVSRGKKQRIKKRLAQLMGKEYNFQ